MGSRTRLFVLLLLLAQSGLALAHRVNVFAYVEGDSIHVEGRFQRDQPARFSEVEVANATGGKIYLAGKTDAEGRFVFTIPDLARAERADLRILLKAGEGHQNEWTVPAGEYLGAIPPMAETPKQESPKQVRRAVVAKPTQAPAAAVAVCPPPPDITGQVEAAVEKKIAPLRQMLLDSQVKEPGLRDILGGIGYLLGIAGLLAYARAQRLASQSPGNAKFGAVLAGNISDDSPKPGVEPGRDDQDRQT